MEQAKKKIKLLCSDLYFNFLALSSIQKSWKKGKGKEGRKKTAYFDEGAIFTLGSLVKLLLLPTADVKNPEGDDIRHHCSFCPGCHQDPFLFLLLIPREKQGTKPSHRKWRNDLCEL